MKRWCNEGDLDSEVTDGGHRRIAIDTALEFADARGIRTILTPFRPYESHVWRALKAVETERSFEPINRLGVEWARRGDFERLEQLYLTLARAEVMPFSAYADHAVSGLMRSVGAEWQAGRMRVGDEHMVSQAMTGVLLSLRREWLDLRQPLFPRGPVAVVGALEGNQHQLGALCVRITLERQGWTVFYPGADVPMEDFGVIQMSREASLVCISLPPAVRVGDVSRCTQILARFYDRARPYSLVFGGATAMDVAEVTGTQPPVDFPGSITNAPFDGVTFLSGCASLISELEHGLGMGRAVA